MRLQNFEWTRKRIIVAGVLVFLLIVSIVLLSIRGNATINLIPSYGSITVDGKGPMFNGTFNLSPGEHTVSMKADGFADRTQKITIKKDVPYNKTFCLAPSNEKGTKWQADNPRLTLICEGISGEEYNTNTAEAVRKNPVMAVLPYRADGFSIGTGTSKTHPDDPTATAIYVKYRNEDDKMRAENWLLLQNVDLREQEIIYTQQEYWGEAE